MEQRELFNLWQQAKALGLATPTLGLLTDMICCPGGDFCALANAKSIPVAEAIQVRFDDLDYLYDLGEIDLNISGCMNACGHHHVGNIGILGVDKKGEEFFQISWAATPVKNRPWVKSSVPLLPATRSRTSSPKFWISTSSSVRTANRSWKPTAVLATTRLRRRSMAQLIKKGQLVTSDEWQRSGR